MPIDIEDLDGGIGVLITISNPLEDKEYFEALSNHFTQDEAKLKRYRYTIGDYTGLTTVNVSNNTIELVADMCKAASTVNPNSVIGISAPEDLAYGLTRMTQMLIDDTEWELEVFRNKEDAETWIRERVKVKYGIDDLSFS